MTRISPKIYYHGSSGITETPKPRVSKAKWKPPIPKDIAESANKTKIPKQTQQSNRPKPVTKKVDPFADCGLWYLGLIK